jgi:uncharacterized protein (DUF1697 family)
MRYVAFLRGINVGSHRVKMIEIRDAFQQMGFKDVSSYINSGNIFFDTDLLDREGLQIKIEQQLKKLLGYEVPTFVRTVDELENIVEQNPYKDIELTTDKRFCVIFSKGIINQKLKLPQYSSKEDMNLIATNQYEAFVVWHIINGRPPSGKFTADVIPSNNTTRFYHTLIKILTAAKL